jgi:hypothetical protein
MMDRTPNTLFDRLVERTLYSGPVVEAPVEPLFERFDEEMVEEPAASPRPAPAGMAEAAASGPSRATVHARTINQAPARPATPRVEASAIEPRLMHRGEQAAPTSLHRDAVRPGAPETHVLNVRETRTADAPAPAGRLRAAAPRSEAPREVRVEHRISEAPAAPAPSVVEPDLPPSIPQHPAQAVAMPAQVSAEPAIHVTIGRLEIRAGGKEKPAARRPRTTQGPSLEQYLTQRRGGAQ